MREREKKVKEEKRTLSKRGSVITATASENNVIPEASTFFEQSPAFPDEKAM